MRKSEQAYPVEIAERIFYIRGQKIMLDFDLAQMYGVETRALKQAVRRNRDHFPKDFMFILNLAEMKNMVSQNVIPSLKTLGGAKPMVFTEQGVSMLSSVLLFKCGIYWKGIKNCPERSINLRKNTMASSEWCSMLSNHSSTKNSNQEKELVS